MNSSPPVRYTVPAPATVRCRQAATFRMCASPAGWPWASLICFRPSRSIAISVRTVPVEARLLIASVRSWWKPRWLPRRVRLSVRVSCSSCSTRASEGGRRRRPYAVTSRSHEPVSIVRADCGGLDRPQLVGPGRVESRDLAVDRAGEGEHDDGKPRQRQDAHASAAFPAKEVSRRKVSSWSTHASRVSPR